MNKTILRMSKRQEYKVRDIFIKHGFNAKRVPVSGASAAIKGDIIAKVFDYHFFIENKATTKAEIRLQTSWFDKISEYATTEKGTPALTITMNRRVYVFLPRNRVYETTALYKRIDTKSFIFRDELCYFAFNLTKAKYIQEWRVWELDQYLLWLKGSYEQDQQIEKN